MKTYNNNPKNMLDMIFENKNKNYGAYAIRNAYNDTVIKSLTIVASSLLLLVGSSLVYNNYFGDKPAEKSIEAEQVYTEITVNMEQPKTPEQPKIEQAAGSQQAMTALPTQIIDTAPETPPTTATLGPITAVGDSSDHDGPLVLGPGTSTITVVPTSTPIIEPTGVAEVMPEFPGGLKALQQFLENNIKYPQIELEAGIQGKVFVKFVVNVDGSISSTEILKGVAGGEGLSREAIRVIKSMPKWKPGKQGNNYVPVYFNLPINFRTN